MRKLKLRAVGVSLLLVTPLMTGCDTMQGLMGDSGGRDDTRYSSASTTVTTYDNASLSGNASSDTAQSSSSAAASPKPAGQSMTTKSAVPMSAPTVGQ